jgi:hypothetical protein
MSNGYFVDIIRYADDETEKTLGPFYSERQAEKAERGLWYQLDHSRFYTQVRR